MIKPKVSQYVAKRGPQTHNSQPQSLNELETYETKWIVCLGVFCRLS